MKTGRRRKKQKKSESPESTSFPPPSSKPKSKPKPRPKSAPARPASKKPTSALRPPPVLLILIALFVLFIGAILCAHACLGPREEPATYLPATADGSWITTVNALVPSVTVEERERADCEADADCTVIPGTCRMREGESDYTERVVDEYDDYAYSIYYEELEDKLYEASGQRFVVTQLNPPGDWWEGERHYVSEEWLDRETCQYTNYTVWVTDPQDPEYEVEVVLAECEVWDHVVVKERVYQQAEYCRTRNLGTFEVQDTFTSRGDGSVVEWPNPALAEDGKLERAFEGTVVFRADGVRHTVKTDDEDKYVRYLTVPHYLGLDEDGDVVRLTTQP